MKEKVLLIADDVEMNRAVVRKFFSREFEVLEAENGLQTLEILRTHHVDMLVLDIIMPEMDGIAVLKEVRADEALKDVGVLVATSTKERTERMALASGADDVVAKPYDPLVMTRRIDNILASRELARRGTSFAVPKQDARQLLERMVRTADSIMQNAYNSALVIELAGQIGQEARQLLQPNEKE